MFDGGRVAGFVRRAPSSDKALLPSPPGRDQHRAPGTDREPAPPALRPSAECWIMRRLRPHDRSRRNRTRLPRDSRRTHPHVATLRPPIATDAGSAGRSEQTQNRRSRLPEDGGETAVSVLLGKRSAAAGKRAHGPRVTTRIALIPITKASAATMSRAFLEGTILQESHGRTCINSRSIRTTLLRRLLSARKRVYQYRQRT